MLAANESATEKAMRDFAVADRMASLPDDLEAYRYDANCNGTEAGSYAINVTSTGREGNRTYHVLCEMGDGSNTTFDVTVSQFMHAPPVRAEGEGGGESQGEGGSDSGGGNSTSSESDVEEKNATDSGKGTKDGSADDEEDDEEDKDKRGKKKLTLGHRGLPGWDKERWNNVRSAPSHTCTHACMHTIAQHSRGQVCRLCAENADAPPSFNLLLHVLLCTLSEALHDEDIVPLKQSSKAMHCTAAACIFEQLS